MCGIAGFVSQLSIDGAAIRIGRMTDALRHRGPDGDGTKTLTSAGGSVVALGHRRLAIIDPVGGAPPYVSDHSEVIMSYNGEIYNYIAIRNELIAAGHEFKTTGDVEVVATAYLQWGTECFSRFRGMFALAIWDARRQKLVMARDHFGKKPFFYKVAANSFIFASEPKAILAFSGERHSLDVASLASFLEWRYVPAPRTLFADILKLLPGCHAEWDGG